jgi:hypothetical protein
MIKLDNSSYKQLKEHENILAAAYKGNYLNAPYLTVKTIYDIVVKVGYNGQANFTCTRCRLNFIKEVGKAYFDYKQKLADSAEKARIAKAAKSRQNAIPEPDGQDTEPTKPEIPTE